MATEHTLGPDARKPSPAETARLSGAAVFSVLLAVGSMLSCFVLLALSMTGHVGMALSIFALPLLGVIAAVLGLIALARISQSGGRLAGRRLAILGLFVGLLGAVTQGAMVFGALRTYFDIRNTLVPNTAAFVEPLMRGDFDAAREKLSEDASAVVSEHDLDRFARAVGELAGGPPVVEIRIGELFRTVASMRAIAQGSAKKITGQVRPVQVVGDRGSCALFVVLNEEALRQKQVRIDDLLLVRNQPFQGMPLRRDGVALEIAQAIGLSLESENPPPQP